MSPYFDGDFQFGDPPDDGGGNPCGECGYDHDLEIEEAREWHNQNPCPFCIYEFGIGHGPNCVSNMGDADG